MANSPRPPGPNKTTESQIGPKVPRSGVPADGGTSKPWPFPGPLPSAVAPPQLPTDTPRFFLERHSPEWGLVNLTPWVSNLVWTHRIREPWTTIEATLSVPFGNMNVLPDPNDVLVVRGLDGGCRAWGFCEQTPDPPITALPHGAVASHRITINAISWLARLRTVQIFASPQDLAINQTTVGTFFALNEWQRIFDTIVSTVSGAINDRMRQILPLLCKIQLPKSLGDGFLGDLVAAVVDQTSADVFANGLPVDQIEGAEIRGIQNAFPNASNALEVLMGTLVSDPRMIEFWEDVEPDPNAGEPPPQSTRDAAVSGAEELARLIGSPVPEVVAETASLGLAQRRNIGRRALGGTPYMVYRLAPFRTESLRSYLERGAAKAESSAASGGTVTVTGSSALGGAAVTGASGAATGAFAGITEYYNGPPTWQPSKGAFVDGDTQVFDFRARRSDSERINAVTVTMPGIGENPLRFWKDAGLPYKDDENILRNGFRLYQVAWPFFPPNMKGDVVRYLRITAGLGAMMFLGNERFRAGSFSTFLRSGTAPYSDIRVGRPCTVALTQGITFTCYVEQASHQLTVNDNGSVFGRTTIGFSRGLYNAPGVSESPSRKPVTVAISPVPSKSTTTSAAGQATGQRKAATGVLFNGQEIAWDSAHYPLDRWLLTKSLGTRTKRTRAGVDIAVLHYTAGAPGSTTASGGRATFNVGPAQTNIAVSMLGYTLPTDTIAVDDTTGFASRGRIIVNGATVSYASKTATSFVGCTNRDTYDGTALVPSAPVRNTQVDSHFIIEADGKVVQIMDLALSAIHAGNSAVNARSIGVDFVCPDTDNRPQQDTSLPWQYKTGYAILGLGVNTATKKFYSPSALQVDACRYLLSWANTNLGVQLVAPAATGNQYTVQMHWPGPFVSGVYHHAEVLLARTGETRQDCIGIYIPTDLL